MNMIIIQLKLVKNILYADHLSSWYYNVSIVQKWYYSLNMQVLVHLKTITHISISSKHILYCVSLL